MILQPSVVLGVGTSGAQVLTNVERLFYEVLGDAKLDLFRLLVIETNTSQRELDPAAHRYTQTVDAFEHDIGRAIQDLSHRLGDDFNWCPRDLRLAPGKGAGNVRAGGRLMLHSRFPEIYSAVHRAVTDTTNAASQNATTLAVQQLFEKRSLEPPRAPINAHDNVAYVVGTLAGGTCSGMCIDLGYMLRQIDPKIERVGIFFIPGPNAAPTFLENTWAALEDMEYFVDHPDQFQGVWYSEQHTRFPYTRGAAKPYDHIYLVSSLNQSGQTRLEYDTKSQSPLSVMVGTMLAADLLGAHSIRADRLVNLNQQIQGPEKRRTFLNFNLRAISYPKYEISEAAACKVVAESICANWLSLKQYKTRQGTTTEVLEDNERERGREWWNTKFPSVWEGTGPSVEIAKEVEQIAKHQVDSPGKLLKFEFTSDAQGTIFSKVDQTMRTRLDAIKAFVIEGVRNRMEQSLNLRAVELFLEGIAGEVEQTRRYWEQIGIPAANQGTAWTAFVNRAVDQLLAEWNGWSYKILGAGRAVLEDSVLELRTRLSMHRMTIVLDAARQWMTTEQMGWLRGLRSTLQDVSSIASERANQIVTRLHDDRSGPVLRVSRSREEGFAAEVAQLAREYTGALDRPFLEIFEKTRAAEDRRAPFVFQTFKTALQPDLLRLLAQRSNVNIATQLRDQNQVGQAATYLRNALHLSLATTHSLQTAATAVPSYIIAKDVATAGDLRTSIQEAQVPGLQNMELKELPVLDHMAIFYQEGGDLEPAGIMDADQYRATRDNGMKSNPQYLDPLGYMKRSPTAAAVATGPIPIREAQSNAENR